MLKSIAYPFISIFQLKLFFPSVSTADKLASYDAELHKLMEPTESALTADSNETATQSANISQKKKGKPGKGRRETETPDTLPHP